MASYFLTIVDEGAWGIGLAAHQAAIEDGVLKHNPGTGRWSQGRGEAHFMSRDLDVVEKTDGKWVRVKNSSGEEAHNYRVLSDFLNYHAHGVGVPIFALVEFDGDKIVSVEH